jgi:AAA domain
MSDATHTEWVERIMSFDHMAEQMEAARDLPPIQRKLTVASLTRREGTNVHLLVKPGAKVIDPQALLDYCDLDTWCDLPLPVTTRHLGDVLLTAGRLILAGGTGLGKTQLAHGMACGIASGHGFLHWTCDRPARVLVIDGEMSKRLIKDRLQAARQRHGHPIPKGNLVTFSVDRAEEMTVQFPGLGKCAPFNTSDGIAFAKRLIALMKPEVVIFDNVMSLLKGDQKDEAPWSDTEPLRSWLVSNNVAQVWLDHTGNDRSRQYGSSTKRWSADAVGILQDNGTPGPNEVKFKLTFDAPHGKARERSGANWRDFDTYAVTMAGDTWTSTRVSKDAVTVADAKAAARGKGEPKPFAILWHEALVTVLTRTGAETVDREEWFTEGAKRNLTEAIEDGDSRTVKEAKRLRFRRAVHELI